MIDVMVTIIIALLLLSLAVWCVEQLPLPEVPKRIGMALLGVCVLLYVMRHLQWVRF